MYKCMLCLTRFEYVSSAHPLFTRKILHRVQKQCIQDPPITIVLSSISGNALHSEKPVCCDYQLRAVCFHCERSLKDFAKTRIQLPYVPLASFPGLPTSASVAFSILTRVLQAANAGVRKPGNEANVLQR